MINIPIEISARHIHLSQKDLEILFGLNYRLTPIKDLSQPGQFASKEAVEVQNLQSWGAEPHMDFTFGKAPDHNQLRILGPVREYTQVELSWSDFIALGLEPRVALSGDYKSSAGGVIIVGPVGEVKLTKGAIIAQRHIHCSEVKAREFELRDGQIVAVKVISVAHESQKCYNEPVRQITFHNVAIRVSPHFDWQMHIDADEANAAGIKKEGVGEVILF